jgi:hypothetical protein
MDFMSNCIFIDEATFHINMKRTIVWSKKGVGAIIIVPKTRAKATTILGTISPFGVVNVKVRHPRAQAFSNKRKAAGSSSIMASEITKSDTIAGHYFNFVAKTLAVMNPHPAFKEHYLVMDSAPIHQHTNIQKYIEVVDIVVFILPPPLPSILSN